MSERPVIAMELETLATRAHEAAEYCFKHPGHVETSGQTIADLYACIARLAKLTQELAER
jgi:hypothetical protein